MALHYLIDGYNLLYALPALPPGSWQEKRAQLLDFLRHRKPQGNNRVTVVFDSRQGLGEQLQVGDITVVFTAGETADDRLSEMVRQANNPRLLVVVTNDLGIRAMVRGTGARFLSCDDFLKKTLPKPFQERRTRPRPDASIEEEFRKKWL